MLAGFELCRINVVFCLFLFIIVLSPHPAQRKMLGKYVVGPQSPSDPLAHCLLLDICGTFLSL